jgi:hypothetical protein
MVRHGSRLAGSIGAIIGVGPERGTGLMVIGVGTFMTLIAIAAYCVPTIRKIDELTSPRLQIDNLGNWLEGKI